MTVVTGKKHKYNRMPPNSRLEHNRKTKVVPCAIAWGVALMHYVLLMRNLIAKFGKFLH